MVVGSQRLEELLEVLGDAPESRLGRAVGWLVSWLGGWVEAEALDRGGREPTYCAGENPRLTSDCVSLSFARPASPVVAMSVLTGALCPPCLARPLVVTSADRLDIVLGLLAARLSVKGPSVAGVLLTQVRAWGLKGMEWSLNGDGVIWD